MYVYTMFLSQAGGERYRKRKIEEEREKGEEDRESGEGGGGG